MEVSDRIGKEAPGVCRCCLTEGCFKDMSSEHSWMGDREVYADMLIDCFDISISLQRNGPNGLKRLICEVCITRLRDACNFKKQVLDAENKFIEKVENGLYVQLETKAIKNEETDFMELEAEYLEDDFVNEQSGDEAIASEFKVEEEDVPLSSLTKTKSKPVKRKAEAAKKPKTKKATASKKTEKGRDVETQNKIGITSTARNRLLKKIATTILEHSTAVPFKWHRQNYLCFFCHKYFIQFRDLREHTLNSHRGSNLKAAVSYLRRDEMVKADITGAQCKLCHANVTNITSFKEHIQSKHNASFLDTYGDGVVPFRFINDSYQCGICDSNFSYFIKLNQHMNLHYDNYVCESCGKRFMSQDRLRCHSLMHGAKFKCNYCSGTFETLILKRQHSAVVHNKIKLPKCMHCDDTFANYVERKKHLISAHGLQIPEFKCEECGKSFHIMSKMRVHIKEVHAKEKNFSCSVCEKKFFSTNHVKKHMIKHYGERVHQCQVCKKSYARKQTLRDHLRIHTNDRRFVCAVCSQAFIQNNSLKLHMRVHHPENVA